MQNDNLKVVRDYAVLPDSLLGNAFVEYRKRCSECEEAAHVFIKSLPKEYNFFNVDDDTEYIGHVNFNLQPDVEAGGVSMIVSPRDDIAPDLKLWRPIKDADGTFYYVPRMNRERRYIPVSKARKIMKSETAIRWSFSIDEKGDIVAVTYDKVKNFMLPADKDAIRKHIGKPIIPPMLRLALAHYYTLVFDDFETETDLNRRLIEEKIKALGYTLADIQQARRLCDAMSALPVVPNGTLVRLLGLTQPVGLKSRDVVFSYEVKADGTLHFSTNLIPSNSDILSR